VGCIWNGAMIVGAANMLHLPLTIITGLLGGLALNTVGYNDTRKQLRP